MSHPFLRTASLLDELMTVEQVAEKLQLRKSTVEDYARRGVLPGFKLGRHVRFRRSELEQAIVDLSTRKRIP
jgi:excisionase family DNA binding protein